MKTDEDKLLEKLVDTVMKDSVLETPSLDFTTKVMSQVLTTKTSEIYVYKPLISLSVWMIIFSCIIAVFIYNLLNGKPQNESWFNHYLSQINNGGLGISFEFSKITLYSVVIATLMLFMQISFLKKYFDDQFDK